MRLRDVITQLGRVVVVLGIVAVVGIAAWYAFVDFPATLTELLGVVFVVLAILVGLQAASRLGRALLPTYNVAEVPIDGPITRDGGGGGLPRGPTSPGADDLVEQIERADEDRSVEALVLKLNTPGGQVVPSEDIRRAAASFDGPTVAYATDLCASGGMWIASGCDEVWAREGSLVGSIGVLFSQVRVDELFEEHGIAYERIVSGEYKDALSSFKALDEDERNYLQALSDAWYEKFVDRVADGTGMDADDVRNTEAKVFLGDRAADIGMIDELGDRDDVEERLESRLGTPVTIAEFEPSPGLRDRLRGGAASVAYAFGAGMGDALGAESGGLEMR